MKFMITFSLQPDTKKRSEGIARFKKIGQKVPAGAKFIGRLTKADLSGGYVLLETDDPNALADFAYDWSDLMELSVVPVVDDEGLHGVFGGNGRAPNGKTSHGKSSSAKSSARNH